MKANLEDGYGRISNRLLEALALTDLNGTQLRIFLFIMRRTYSWGEKSDEISLAEFVEACGNGKSYISEQIKELVNRDILKRISRPGKPTLYQINSNINEWKECSTIVEQLNINTEQGLYKSRTSGLHNSRTSGLHESRTPSTTQPIDNNTHDTPPKERLKKDKEINNNSGGENEVLNKKIINLYQQSGMGLLDYYSSQRLTDLIDFYSGEWVLEAIQISIDQNKRNIAYTEAILKNWKANGKNADTRKKASGGDSQLSYRNRISDLGERRD